MVKKKISIILSLFLCILIIFTGCSKNNDTNITKTDTVKVSISGSTSVGPLIENEAEKFKMANENINVEINQLGSSAGIKDAINGTVEIGMSSRDLTDEERSQGLTEVEIAYDGIAIITHDSNDVDNLTFSQVKDIYTGKITNWKEVGGKDSAIAVVSREEGSGTRDTFQNIIGYKSEELIKEAQIGDGSGNIKSLVSGNENAIGFISFEYVDDSIEEVKTDNVEPSAENVTNGSYKIARPFLLIYKENNLTENGNKFINFILSEEGQKIVEENGLIRVDK